jgi:hypothetical protein
MAWVNRNGKRYFYKTSRVGGAFVRTYLGNGKSLNKKPLRSSSAARNGRRGPQKLRRAIAVMPPPSDRWTKSYNSPTC